MSRIGQWLLMLLVSLILLLRSGSQDVSAQEDENQRSYLPVILNTNSSSQEHKFVQASQVSPAGFRLPFVGQFSVSNGPNCGGHLNNGSYNDQALDFVPAYRDIVAAASGTAYYRLEQDGGKVVHIVHEGSLSGYKSIYAHLDSVTVPQDGSPKHVQLGEKIGVSGASGYTNGAHLHFAILTGFINPTGYGPSVPIYDLPGISGWTRNPATEACIQNGSNEATAVGPPINSLPPTPIPDTQYPHVNFVTPTDRDHKSSGFDLIATASDDTGVVQVEFRALYDGSWRTIGDGFNQPDGTWKFTWNDPPEKVVELRARAHDGFGKNTDTQPCFITIDKTKPTITLSEPRTDQQIGSTIRLVASASDSVGVTRVEFKGRVNGGNWETIATDTNGSDGFNGDWNVGGHAANSVFDVLAYAFDQAGNSQQSGAATNLRRDQSPPVVSILEPTIGSLISGRHAISVQVDDPSGIARVDVHVYYLEIPGQPQVRHVFERITQIAPNVWRMEEDISDPAKRAMPDPDAWVQVFAWDNSGVLGTSSAVRFKTFYQTTISVDARKQWSELTSTWSQRFPVFEGGIVRLDNVGGTSYSAPDQPQPPHGDGTVCIPNCLIHGPAKSLVMVYTRPDAAITLERYAGSFYEGTAHATGYVKFGFNDALNNFADNSGAFTARLTAYPPGVSNVTMASVFVEERQEWPPGSVCPHVQLWIESSGSIKKFTEWESCSNNWLVKEIQLPSYYLNGLTAIWLNFTNDLTDGIDRNYFVRKVTVNERELRPTTPGAQYCLGLGAEPFTRQSCGQGSEDLRVNGAVRLPYQ